MDHIWTVLLLLCGLHQTSTETHSLQYCFMVSTSSQHIPEFIAVGMVDEQPFQYCDSNNGNLTLKMEWVKKIEGSDYRKKQKQEMDDKRKHLNTTMTTIINTCGVKNSTFNNSTGIHTLLRIYGCKIYDDNTTEEYEKYIYDGEDFISLDLKTETWTPANDCANTIITKLKLKENIGSRMSYLKNVCIDRLREFSSYAKSTLERKDRPVASMFHKHFSRPELVCHATGFFPKEINITWLKDGKKMDVSPNDTLPNQDGSFQKRAVLRVSPEELKKHNYTCEVQHSSLEKDLVPIVPGSVEPEEPVPLGIIIGAAITAILVALIAGVLIWMKKKKFGFSSVPIKVTSQPV
ncbi:patr class I histocompatibility antigen, A-2 alpha chain-like [Trichomycterus rosablanca]|uniref:patr class I histocompatibility antigen, A-2 alpha chain-like n=1 Tax=Trichomycterus rosablanca TaxID=2290929 RepID=UPI002F3500CE